MKVKELLDILQRQNPDAEVRLMAQPSWPFEYALLGAVVRQDILLAEGTEDQPPDDGWRAANDILLVEGEQLSYGLKEAWQMARR